MPDVKSRNDVRPVLEVLIALISFGAGASVILSSIYNWAYFKELGLISAEILTPTDILVSSFAWLPTSLLGCFIGWAVGFLWLMALDEIEGHRSEDPSFVDAQRPSMKRAFRFSVWIFFLGSITSYLITPPGDLGVVVMASLLWMLLAPRATATAFGRKAISDGVRVAVTYIPVACAFVFYYGNSAGQSTLTDTSNAEMVLVDLNGTELTGALIRPLERGIILRQKGSDKIDFVTWEHVTKIETTVVKSQRVPRFCQWTGVLCPSSQNSKQIVVKKPPAKGAGARP